MAFRDFNLYLVHLLRESTRISSVATAHAKILKLGCCAPSTTNHLINGYLRCGFIHGALQLFDEMSQRNVVSWTSIMAGFICNGFPKLALQCLNKMVRCGIQPNSYTLATAVSACAHLADLRSGYAVHARIETIGLHNDAVVATALTDMYGKSSEISFARKVFDGMLNKNIVSWGSMISAYSQNAYGSEALDLFRQLITEKSTVILKPNHFILSSIVNACAGIGRLGFGKTVHASVIRHGHEKNDFISGALVDMYAKCGCIDYSSKVFGGIQNPSLVPYTAMIGSAAKHGQVKICFGLFNEMISKNLKPNCITLLGVLHACNHSGLVDTGLKCLKFMKEYYNVDPTAKHYTCAVDMLGRAGQLDEAINLSKDFKVEGDDALMIWSTLIAACKNHGRLDLAVGFAKMLDGFKMDVAGSYQAVLKTYEIARQWENADKIRSVMMLKDIRKEPGCSWVEVKDVPYVFYAGGFGNYARSCEAVEKLRELDKKMEEMGCMTTREGLVFDDFENEDDREKHGINVHSEKIAVAYALISVPRGATIRVMKNLKDV